MGSSAVYAEPRFRLFGRVREGVNLLSSKPRAMKVEPSAAGTITKYHFKVVRLPTTAGTARLFVSPVFFSRWRWAPLLLWLWLWLWLMPLGLLLGPTLRLLFRLYQRFFGVLRPVDGLAPNPALATYP